ncbi:MAG: hypothetical protein QW678_00535 [Candidatus Aenigmatarchaeota archaeon]
MNDLIFIIGLGLIFIGIFLIILSVFLNSKKEAKSESGFVIVVWPFFVAGGNEKIVPILLILAIILSIILFVLFILKVFH